MEAPIQMGIEKEQKLLSVTGTNNFGPIIMALF